MGLNLWVTTYSALGHDVLGQDVGHRQFHQFMEVDLKNVSAYLVVHSDRQKFSTAEERYTAVFSCSVFYLGKSVA